MTADKSRFVVDADWVEKQLGAPEFRIVDAAWYLPAQNRNGAEEYAAGHIPGAVFFDQDVIADHSTGLPHSIPSPEFFAAEVGKLGIAATDTIVVHDGPGFFSAPRAGGSSASWAQRRSMCSTAVSTAGSARAARCRPICRNRHPQNSSRISTPRKVTTFEAMKDIVASGSKQIADARGAGRFTAEEPEPRAGMRGGHMPGAKNLPISVFSDAGRFKSLSEIKDTIEKAGSISRSPSSPAAVPASPPPSSRWR